MSKKLPIVQQHHINYEPPWTVKVYKGEHHILTQLQWRKNVSKGFLIALQHYIVMNEPKAADLNAQAALAAEFKAMKGEGKV